MDDLTTLSIEELTALAAEKREAAKALAAMEAPTKAQVAEATALWNDSLACTAEIAAREGAEAATPEELAAALALFADEPAEGPEAEPEAEAATEEPEAEPVEEPEAEVEAEPVAAAVKKPVKTVAALAKQTKRPITPKQAESMLTITAAANTDFPAGQEIDLMQVGEAAVAKMKSFQPPTSLGRYIGREDEVPEGMATEQWSDSFPLAKINLDYPEDLLATNSMSDATVEQVMRHAADETRLPGDSLVAAAGWCAPSEIIYDLCDGEKVDGILSVPEIGVKRGGFKHTTGTDFATVYAAVGFMQTETEAIAGTTKTCYEVPCPTFSEERLDVIGLCIRVPILLEVGYPEQVKSIMAKSLIAHEYKKNTTVISRIVTKAGAARNFTVDLGSTVVDTLSSVALVATQLRQKYRLGQTATMEVVLPTWAKEVFREDLSTRTGRAKESVSDAEIASHFSVRHVNVQYVYSWQELTVTDLAWPTTMNFLAYPAGTFVVGKADVISMSAVYDHASLITNTYTGLFTEQGLLLAQMCYNAVQGTVPVCNAGRTGAANITCA